MERCGRLTLGTNTCPLAIASFLSDYAARADKVKLKPW
jgi:hypothetical protein